MQALSSCPLNPRSDRRRAFRKAASRNEATAVVAAGVPRGARTAQREIGHRPRGHHRMATCTVEARWLCGVESVRVPQYACRAPPTPHNWVTESYASDWTVEQLRESAQRVADRIDALIAAGTGRAAALIAAGTGRAAHPLPDTLPSLPAAQNLVTSTAKRQRPPRTAARCAAQPRPAHRTDNDHASSTTPLLLQQRRSAGYFAYPYFSDSSSSHSSLTRCISVNTP